MKRSELISFLSSYLELARFVDIDPSTNGLVVGAPEDREVSTVAFAVDASLSTFRLAVQKGADMLFTHHGLFWGHPLPIIGSHYRRIKILLDHNLDLFVSHLPLDAHGEVGNNVQMAKILGLSNITPFAPFRGIDLGWWGRSERALDSEEICRSLGFTHAAVLPYGRKDIHTVGFVSGSGSDDLASAIALGLDCFVTGVAAHEQFSDCVENRITMIGGGHYQSEVFGVQAVSRLLDKRFGLKTVFLDDPTGL
ncbi:MAG: Nif3-like dinuclear metal center hexameric protein [Sphaerochaetaceae bacterium]